MKKKSKAVAASANSQKPLDIGSVEALMDVMLAEYIQVNTVPTGRISGGPETHSDATQTIQLTPLCHFERGCPQNLSEFIKTTTGKQKPTRQVAFEWWSCTRLRFSCSTLCCTFIKELVPSLQAVGIHELQSRLVGKKFRLEDLEILSINFVPEKRHEILLKYPFLPARTEIVEATLPGMPCCSHNVLCCKKSGLIFDMALGQFLGTMQTFVFASMEDFLSKLPGQVLDYGKTTESAILQQYSLDDSAPRKLISPDAAPKNFAKRVLSACQAQKDYCWNCKGIASPGTTLKRCTKCHLAKYCDRDCQLLHWASHKTQCSSAKASDCLDQSHLKPVM